MTLSSAWCYSCGCWGILLAGGTAEVVGREADPVLLAGAGRTTSDGAAHQRGSSGAGHPRCGSQPEDCTWAGATESGMEGQHIGEPVVAGASAAAVAGRLHAGPFDSTCPPSSGVSRVRVHQWSRRDRQG